MKFSVCNELFGDMPLERACAIMKETGFDGVEFAPYTVFGDFSHSAVRAGLGAIRHALTSEGLAFAGFHWLLAKPAGLHFADPDPAVRRRTRDHLGMLVDAAGELGGGMLILGSPKQRGSLPGADRAEARQALRDALASLGPRAAASASPILIEQLSPDQTDVINTMAEAAALVDEIHSPGISSMFDFHNSISESEPWHALIENFYPYIRHVHVNEVDGRAPGTGNSDYLPAWKVLMDKKFEGWVSMEIFEIPENPEQTLRGAMSLFRGLGGK